MNRGSLAAARERAKARMLQELERQVARAEANGEHRSSRILINAANELLDHNNPYYFATISRLRHMPVTIDEFIQSPEFLGDQVECWPALLSDLKETNPDILAGEGQVNEYLDAGATGCHARGTRILMFDGTVKAVEDVQVGDQLMGPDSNPRNVLALARGRERMVRVTPSKGPAFVVNESHIMSLRRGRKTATKTDSLAGTIVSLTVKDYLSRSATFQHLHKLRRVAVDFPPSKKPLLIPPYILGVWLGDGTSIRAAITNEGDEVLDAWHAYAAAIGCRVECSGIEHRISNNVAKWDENPARRAFKDIGVMGDKHIPHTYLTASREDRKALLAGLVDTDGHLSCGGYEITQRSKRLSSDIIYLARSLGYRATVSDKVVGGRTYQRIFISGDLTSLPVRIPRKRAPEYKSTRDWRVEGFSVESLPEDDYFGFSLDGDHLYLTDDFLVHHNTGKSFKATVTQAYQLYWLTCIQKPQTLYQLSAATPIIFMFQSVSEKVTKRVLYEPFRNMFTAMPYCQRWLTYDKHKDAELILPDHNVQVVPALAAVQSMVGQAIISGILDEVNFMTVIENSQTVMEGRSLGGRFDQAEVAHTTISRRRKSRFTSRGPVPGCIAVLSSIRYKGDFLDRRIDQVKENQEPDVRVYRRKQYEVQPQERYTGETFRVLVGTAQYSTRILEDADEAGVNYPESGTVEDVPIEYYYEFKNDPESALRDVIGVASDVITPFITQRHKVMEAIVRGREVGLKSFLDNDNVELATQGMPQINEENLPSDKDAERFVHIDLSISGDSCGIAMVRVDGFVDIENKEGIIESQPNIVVEMACSIKPSAQEHIDIAEVRKWVMQLIAFYNFNVYMISYDGFQSTESIQLLRRAGIRSEMISTERTMEPYKYLRDCFYQDRISMVDNEVLRLELANLEYNEKKKKVDHPPRGSNDIADALCGAVFAASTSRRVRTQTATKTRDGQIVRTSRSGARKKGSRRIRLNSN